MCVIYACQTIMPPDEELRRGSETNEDGAGISWLDPDGSKIHWKKDLADWKGVLKFIKEEKLKLPYAIHFRSASVGGKSVGLAHPFPIAKGAPLWVEGTGPSVLHHNGHLSDWSELVMKAGLASKEEFPLGPWSDSRGLAWLVHLKGEGILPFIVGQSRVLMMSVEPNTYDGEEYNRAEDHFTYYGTGWIHKKDGWSQSVDTYDRWSRTPGRWNYVDPRAKDDDTETAVTKPTCSTTSTACSPYIWTVEDLTTLLAELQEGQKNAKLATGA